MLYCRTYKPPSQKMQTSDTFFFVLMCRFLMIGRGKQSVSKSSDISNAELTIDHVPKFIFT